jgi:uncharacterized protein (DUF2062 family)
MPKRLIKRITPDHETIRSHKHMRIFGTLLHDPRLWHLNRRSAAGAFAIGLFMAFVPVPFQMLLAAGGAILTRVNLPLSVALVWLTNPITMPPVFYFCYLVGAALLGHPVQPFHFSLPGVGLAARLNGIWAPFLLGCLVCGAAASLIGYLGIHALWRWHVVRQLRRRRARSPTVLPP